MAVGSPRGVQGGGGGDVGVWLEQRRGHGDGRSAYPIALEVGLGGLMFGSQSRSVKGGSVFSG